MNAPLLRISDRVAALRHWMRSQNLQAFIVPSSDPHNSEYPAPHWKCREWISGFDGSAGTALVTLHHAALWTDSRYFLQAEQQLLDTPFQLMREGECATPSLTDWLQQTLAAETAASKDSAGRIGFCAETCTLDFYESLSAVFSPDLLCPTTDPFSEIWPDRQALPQSPLYRQPDEYVAKSAREKIEDLCTQQGEREGETFLIVSELAEIAWLLNLRASDVEYNPVFMAYLVANRGRTILFTHPQRVNTDIRHYLSEQGVELRDYAEIFAFVATVPKHPCRFLVPPTLNLAVYHPLRLAAEANEHLSLALQMQSVTALKAVKDEAEIAGFRKAMQADGVALVRFRCWLDELVKNGKIAEETELTIEHRLTAFRAEHPDFRGLSFATIAGYAAHGAIVHYEATPETAARLENKGLLLLDSGAQYLSGTTDITRTIALGELTDEERRIYTLVLKGHIALSRMRFPTGTTGLQLDTAARAALWQEGLDFGHGTGHGVGSHLCVHEGPHQIRKNVRDCTLQPFSAGMTITNEPGLYLAGKFGVRIENVLLVTPVETTDFGNFHRFETLTLCPIDTAPIVPEMLDETEKKWLNDYHAMVRERLLPLLSAVAERDWLVAATRPLR